MRTNIRLALLIPVATALFSMPASAIETIGGYTCAYHIADDNGDIWEICDIYGVEKIGDYTWGYCIANDGAEICHSYYYDCKDFKVIYRSIDPWPQGAIAIPAVLGGNPVTSIGFEAFEWSGLTSVTIPDSVTSIGGAAFDHCTVLTSVTIPGSVTSIGICAFFESGLTSVTIPDSVTYLGIYAFAWCSGLTNVTILGGVTEIGDGMFYHCNSLTSVTIPDSVTRIGNDAFGDCSELTSVTIPDSVTEIGSAFFGCSSLTSITIPDSVTYLGSYAFACCSGLTSVTIPDSVTSIGNSTFYGCTNLTNVTIPDSVASIGNSAFYGCTNLTSVTIGNGVTDIEYDTFCGCNGLTNVTMRGDAPIVGTNAFAYVADWCVVRIPRTAKWYDVVDGKWQGMTVEYYDLGAGGAAVSVGGAAVEFAVSADGKTRMAAVAEGTKAEDIKISVGGVDVTAGYRVSVEGTTATIVLKPPFEQTGETGGASGTPRPTGGGAPWTDNGDGTVALAVAVVPGLYYSAAGAASLEGLQALTPPAAASPAKAGDKLSVPKVDGAQGFYKVWVGEAPF